MQNLFDKHVSIEDLPKKVHPLSRNILCFGDYDIAGNMTLLMRLINKYTIHKARCVIVQGDYLAYDQDIVLVDQSGITSSEKILQAESLFEQADFFHIGRTPVNFGKVNFDKTLNKTNCVFQYFGSYLRNNKDAIRIMHERTGIRAISWVDYTMLDGAGPMFYHIPDIFDVQKVTPIKTIKNNESVTFVHSPTNRHFKQTKLFLQAYDELAKQYKIDLIMIEGASNKACLEMKRAGHVLFDQISVGRFALSAIESMAMRQAVLCSVSNLVMSVFPESPAIPVNESNLKDQMEKLINNKSMIKNIGKKGRAWVEKVCDPKRNIRRYAYLWDMIMHGNRLLGNMDELFINMEKQ